MVGQAQRAFLFALALMALAAPSFAADKVNVGTIGSSSDAGLYIAQAKGWTSI
jgi:ABC-type nitrate/sulfonate/bicarbonate transport system substrate-binding protein